MATIIKSQATLDDLVRLSSSECRYELIRGELVETPPAGGEHGEIAASVIGRLWAHVSANNLGRIYTSETGFLLARDPDLLLAPAAAFIRADSVPPRQLGFYEVAPDLAGEVVALHDSASYVQRKVMEYLQAGVRLVWIVDPENRSIAIYEAGAPVRFLSTDDELDGGSILPCFHVAVADIFA